MRCKNCGWPNKPSETTCVKCHSPLTGGDEDSVVGTAEAGSASSQSAMSYNRTVLEDDVFGRSSSNQPCGLPNPNPGRYPSDNDNQNSASGGVGSVCPKCGYPVRPGSEKCPNCKFQLGVNHPVNESNGFSDQTKREVPPTSGRRPTRMTSSTEGEGVKFRGTINPYMMNLAAEPTFVLKPLKRLDERHELDEMEYEGKEVVLNRSNTEENNPSITSRQQAVVSNVDGHWYIEDRSEQKTTFVQAAQKIELHDGDLILLGNRLFEFRK